MSVYYNEIDKFAAQWLRELMKAGLIPDGEVDERSIADVRPDDLRGFNQCHFFAGIGGWAYALRLAGWPDDREVWTGSCPCQPWSVAGSGAGANDPRHLWPAWSELIGQRRPAVVFGEQVASEDGRYWLDLVFHDMESRGYALAACDLPACCIGAPHKRSRLWFVADSHGERCEGERLRLFAGESRQTGAEAARHGEAGALDDTQCSRAERESGHQRRQERAPQGRRKDKGRGRLQALHAGDARNLGHANGAGLALGSIDEVGRGAVWHEGSALGETGATRGFWSECDWLWFRDGVYRAVEPGTFPLATRVSGDMEQIKGYGNSIVPQVAQVFIEAYLDLERID